MRVIIGCESSGIIREAFQKMGFDAWSCDLLPTEIPGSHYQGNIEDIIDKEWDLGIFHPPCTRLCNSGVRWLNERDLWGEMKLAAEFFKKLLNSNIPHIAVENPIPHKYAMDIIKTKYSQIIQPYDFGHTTSKATCLWLKGLPELRSTHRIPRNQITYDIHNASPGIDRWSIRSKTFQGIADAMADQWGNYLLKKEFQLSLF